MLASLGRWLSNVTQAVLSVCRDTVEGSDAWAVRQRWVSVTPLSLRSDMAMGLVRARQGC